jgi:hypothetical protein
MRWKPPRKGEVEHMRKTQIRCSLEVSNCHRDSNVSKLLACTDLPFNFNAPSAMPKSSKIICNRAIGPAYLPSNHGLKSIDEILTRILPFARPVFNFATASGARSNGNSSSMSVRSLPSFTHVATCSNWDGIAWVKKP